MDMDRYIGRLLDGRYEILEVIGTGGQAVVYKARCHRLNRLVAIKILKDELTQDEEFRRRFHAEGQAVAMLSHPNIVSVYDVSTTDAADYIVMELIDGISLKQYMEKKGVLNWKETLHFAIQIGKALDHAHSRGIIHRDIKPHNVMVLKNGSVKVADFGIAQVVSKNNTLTKEALGSVHYISPEQAKGGRVDNRSDIYSLGVVMYEMMTGRPPYDGESPVAVAIQHINGKAVMPSTLNPNIPGGLEQIIMKAMAQNASKRFSSAKEMLHDMDEFRKDPSILFDYNNTSAGLDDATLIQSAAATEEPSQELPKEPAETPVRRTPEKKSTIAKKKRRRREEVVEEVERGTKVATIAIIACSVVALVAIGIFFATLFSDGGLSTNQDTVSVPNLLGKYYDTYEPDGFVLEVNYYAYSDEYALGQIMSQNPVANTRIDRDSTVTVVVSGGPQPSEIKMEKMTGKDVESAVNYLVKTQGIDEALIEFVYENSADVDEGLITRTDPMEGEAIATGETIYLYISQGPAVVTKTMADLTSDYYNEDSACKWLEANGFKNYRVEHVVSTKAPGKIVSQSVKAGSVVDVTTEIVLQVSSGGETAPSVSTGGNQEPENGNSKLVDVALPDDILEDYVLCIYKDGELIEERQIPEGAISTQFNFTGEGKVTYEIRLSTGISWKLEVDFDATETPETTEDEASE